VELYKQWFQAIKDDIKNKYYLTHPDFMVDGEVLDEEALEKWLKEVVIPPYFWLHYKKCDKERFELKSIRPFPEDKIVMKLINDFLSALDHEGRKSFFTINKLVAKEVEPGLLEEVYAPGTTIYTLPEIKIEMRFLFRRGHSKITFAKEPTIKDDEVIYHLNVEQDSLQNMIKSGYLKLEYSLDSPPSTKMFFPISSPEPYPNISSNLGLV